MVKVKYWLYRNDDWDFFVDDVEANSEQEAFDKIMKENRLARDLEIIKE